MKNRSTGLLAGLGFCALATLSACTDKTPTQESAAAPVSAMPESAAIIPAISRKAVDAKRIKQADQTPGEWLTHGRTYDEQRYSPLNQIDAANVGRLGLAWSYRLPTRRGTEATPLVIDGVLYTTGPWSMVYALDAASGELTQKVVLVRSPPD